MLLMSESMRAPGRAATCHRADFRETFKGSTPKLEETNWFVFWIFQGGR